MSAVICYLMGNLAHLTVGQFRGAVAALAGKKRVMFELLAVPFVPSAGLGALIGVVQRIRENGGNAVVSAARPSVSEVFEIVGLRKVLKFADIHNEAQAFS